MMAFLQIHADRIVGAFLLFAYLVFIFAAFARLERNAHRAAERPRKINPVPYGGIAAAGLVAGARTPRAASGPHMRGGRSHGRV